MQFVDGSRGYSVIQDGSKKPLYILMAATGMVLLIALVNTANLLLARAAARRRELAICAAVGANRGKIVGQLLSEAMVLAIAGGIVAIPLSSLTLNFLILMLGQIAPTMGFVGVESIAGAETLVDFLTMQLEWPVLLYGLGLSLFTGLLFGLYPALEAAHVPRMKVINQESGHISEALGTARVRKALVCAQVMLSATLLIPTGLFLKSLVNLIHMDLGLQTENLVMVLLSPSTIGYKPQQSRVLLERAEQKLVALPGVSDVAAAHFPLLFGGNVMGGGEVEGRSVVSPMNQVSPGFFRQMRIPLIMGREFTDRDNSAGQPVVIINDRFAKTYFPGKNPLGRRIRFGSPTDPASLDFHGKPLA
jgi:hypothetical protein